MGTPWNTYQPAAVVCSQLQVLTQSENQTEVLVSNCLYVQPKPGFLKPGNKTVGSMAHALPV